MLSKQKMKAVSVFLFGKEIKFRAIDDKFNKKSTYIGCNNGVAVNITNNKAKLMIDIDAKNNGQFINTIVENINILQNYENNKIQELNSKKRWKEHNDILIKKIMLEFDLKQNTPKLELLTIESEDKVDYSVSYYAQERYMSNLCKEIYLPMGKTFDIAYKNNRLYVYMVSLKEKDIEIIGNDFLMKNDLQSKLEVVDMLAI